MQRSTFAVLAATLVAFLALLDAADAIECYVCNSMNEPECDGTPPSAMLKNCSDARRGSRYTACRKIDQFVDFHVHELPPQKRVIRQCAVEGEHERPCYYKAGFGGRVNVCHCFESKCNSAPAQHRSLGAAALASAAFILLLRLYSP